METNKVPNTALISSNSKNPQIVLKTLKFENQEQGFEIFRIKTTTNQNKLINH